MNTFPETWRKMAKRMEETAWDPEDADFTETMMNKRIKMCTSYLGWKYTVRLIIKKGIPFDKLKIVEVGCGTGTFSLTLGLLGASVTLIDFNQKILEKAKKVYDLYDCQAEFIKADCLDTPPEEITGKFDLAVSGGLVEHFTGKDRERCIEYHKLLLREGGVAFIGVPNKFSPFYQWIRFFRKLTRTWEIDVEIPFSYMEIRRLAKRVNFKNFYVIGNAPLRRDLVDYSCGFISAVIDIFPMSLKERIRSWKTDIIRGNFSSEIQEDIVKYCHNMVELIKQEFLNEQEAYNKSQHFLTNRFSAGLILFAFK